MSRVIYNVAPRPIDLTCLELSPGAQYLDNIFRGRIYTNTLATPKIRVVNKCSADIYLHSQTIFTDINNGGTFEAKIEGEIIPAFNHSDIQVLYVGTYKGTNNNPTYDVLINGITNTYTLNVSEEDNPPTASKVAYTVPHGTKITVTRSNLVFNDIDGDAITHVRFTGNVSNMFMNEAYTVPYQAGTPLDMNSFVLFIRPPETLNQVTYSLNYDVKSKNVWSI